MQLLLIYLHQYYIGMDKPSLARDLLGDTSTVVQNVPGNDPGSSGLLGRCVIEKNNWLQRTSDAVGGEVTASFLPQNDGSLCQGCEPNYQAQYTCGGSDHKRVMTEILDDVEFDCSEENATCRSGLLQLNDGGYLFFSTGGKVQWWHKYTSGVPVAEYSAAQSKYGTNRLAAGQSLQVGEFVGSPSGDAYLTVIKKGNNVELLVARREGACKKHPSGKNSGNSYAAITDTAAAVYKMKMGPVSTEHRGKVAYINNNNEREFYADGHLKVAGSEKYQSVGEFGQSNVASIATVKKAETSAKCEEECNKLDECYGFIHDEKDASMRAEGSRYVSENSRTDSDGRRSYVCSPE